jgi:hypothetical protein
LRDINEGKYGALLGVYKLFIFLPYKSRRGGIASAPLKALKCFCLFGSNSSHPLVVVDSCNSVKNRVAGCELKKEIIQIIPRNPERKTLLKLYELRVASFR